MNPENALVGIADEEAAKAVGTGFIFHQDRERTLILTCREVADSAPAAWIDGKYEAKWIFGSGKPDVHLAVLECGTQGLDDREPLPLREPLNPDKAARIAVYAGGDRSECMTGLYDFDSSDRGTQLVLRNQPDPSIEPVNRGSPLIDGDFAVGVVTGVKPGPANSPQTNDLIIATTMQQLATEWPAGREHVAPAVPRDIAQEISSPLPQLGAFSARFLVATSEPDSSGDVNNELAVVQETIRRRLPPTSDVELWQWKSPSRFDRLYPAGPPADVQGAPGLEEFDAVFVIAWNNLGPRQAGIEELEQRTRGQKRYFYRRDGASDEVEDFFKRVAIKATNYGGDTFAERFEPEFQFLIPALAAEPGRQQVPAKHSEEGAARQPYRGLQAYTESDSGLFNGRSKETTELCLFLAQQGPGIPARNKLGFLAVLGASGSGKSSLVRAGLFGRLRLDAIPGSKSWPILDLRPSDMKTSPPLTLIADRLISAGLAEEPNRLGLERGLTQRSGVTQMVAKALAKAHANRLIFYVDQFEEIFTDDSSEEFRRRKTVFLQFLHDLALQPAAQVIVTMRADFYPKLLDPEVYKFAPGLREYSLKNPDEQMMVSAMYWPAAASGYRFEDTNLFVRILRDVGVSAGALPLLSYALEQLADLAKKDGSLIIKWVHYREIKGVQGVIQRQVEIAKSKLPAPPTPETLNGLFRRLVKVDEKDAPTKKPADFDESDKSWTPETVALARVLIKQRLLTSFYDEERMVSRIELAHEALLDKWEDLETWIGNSKKALLVLQAVERAAREWRKARGEAPDDQARLEADRTLLWEQERIDQVKKEIQPLGDLSPDVQDFLRDEFCRLVKELEFEITHDRRVEIGERMARLGDRRPGVGLRKVGDFTVPDIVWCKVPGGNVTLAGVDPALATAEVRPFYVSQYAVTLAQFSAFTDPKVYFNAEWWAGLPIKPDDHRPVTQRQVDNHPAQFVSWYQAMAFCRWLSHQLGYDVRLPTEWEWVQAATGCHSDYLYPWGKDWDSNRANHRESAYRLMAVGMYPEGKSPIGAYDMGGNMYQWCLGEFDHPGRTAPSSEPRTTRGGAFFLMPPDVKVQDQLSVRHRLRDKADGTGDVGRRVAVCIRLAADQAGPDATILPDDQARS